MPCVARRTGSGSCSVTGGDRRAYVILMRRERYTGIPSRNAAPAMRNGLRLTYRCSWPPFREYPMNRIEKTRADDGIHEPHAVAESGEHVGVGAAAGRQTRRQCGEHQGEGER